MFLNKVRYLLLLAGFGILAVLYNEYVMTLLLIALILLPFLSFAVLCYVYGKIKADFVSISHVAGKGNTIPISVQLHNPTIFPVPNIKLYLRYKNVFSPHNNRKCYTISVEQRKGTTFSCNLSSGYAGNLVIHLEGIRIYDYLKIFSLRKSCRKELKIAVLPDFHELMDIEFMINNQRPAESDNYSGTKSGDDSSEVFTVREYREGDRPQRIHWKLSRKHNQLMIKEFSEPINCAILLLVQMTVPRGVDSISHIDALLEGVMSVSYTLLMKKISHYISWYDGNSGSLRRIRIAREADFYEVIDGLLQTKPHAPDVDVTMEYMAEHPKEQYSAFLYIAGDNIGMQTDSIIALKANEKTILNIGKEEPEDQEDTSSYVMPFSRITTNVLLEQGITLAQYEGGHIRQLKLEGLTG